MNEVWSSLPVVIMAVGILLMLLDRLFLENDTLWSITLVITSLGIGMVLGAKLFPVELPIGP